MREEGYAARVQAHEHRLTGRATETKLQQPLLAAAQHGGTTTMPHKVPLMVPPYFTGGRLRGLNKQQRASNGKSKCRRVQHLQESFVAGGLGIRIVCRAAGNNIVQPSNK